jgi:hypothetical protein
VDDFSYNGSSVISRTASQVEKPARMKRSRYSDIFSDRKTSARRSIAIVTSNRYTILSVRGCFDRIYNSVGCSINIFSWKDSAFESEFLFYVTSGRSNNGLRQLASCNTGCISAFTRTISNWLAAFFGSISAYTIERYGPSSKGEMKLYRRALVTASLRSLKKNFGRCLASWLQFEMLMRLSICYSVSIPILP